MKKKKRGIGIRRGEKKVVGGHGTPKMPLRIRFGIYERRSTEKNGEEAVSGFLQ